MEKTKTVKWRKKMEERNQEKTNIDGGKKKTKCEEKIRGISEGSSELT